MDDSVGDVMRAYAADAVDIARQKFSIELDYSVESVRQLDAILERYHESVPRGLRKAFSRGPSDAEVAKFAKIWGGYLGEVMRRT